ncbi:MULTISPECIES: hypothetical protein [Rhodococcus]|uniref:hypothetical protein n=1 Tax=Rhodococcus TaxID=1827 RepID=UPI0008154D98|nr:MULTISPECIES: hypothetical protein [Rhodococcus]AZI65452.1 hypothetical protein EHW12_30480 [Rhodococcus sp. NJ-530]SCC69676.1 hypothetical protein GA0061093_12935 [Rhodococcus qingshengii]
MNDRPKSPEKTLTWGQYGQLLTATIATWLSAAPGGIVVAAQTFWRSRPTRVVVLALIAGIAPAWTFSSDIAQHASYIVALAAAGWLVLTLTAGGVRGAFSVTRRRGRQ